MLTLLALIQIPALGGGGNKRVHCASNLRQFSTAALIYAHENDGRLPVGPLSGAWPWDVPSSICVALQETGADWKVMYCPGTAPRFTQTDNWRLYNLGGETFRILGYVVTFPSQTVLKATDRNSTLWSSLEPASRVLLADGTLSGAGQTNKMHVDSYNFVSHQGAYIKKHLSAHLTGPIPAGGNVAMLDGHVEWRRFEDMVPHTAFPVFWW
jgi:prepilin-type processing-associated H-X9-DG protein